MTTKRIYLTLNKAIDICRASELTQTQLQSLHEEVEISVHKVTKQKHRDTSQSTKVKNQGNCTRCGYRHEPRKCPAYGQVCKACHRKNHCAKMCNSRRHTDNRKVQQINKAEADDEEFFIGSIQAEKHDHPVSQINTGEWEERKVARKSGLSKFIPNLSDISAPLRKL